MNLAGHIHLDGWAGRTRHPVRVIGETKKRYRVQLLEETRLPGRLALAGQVVLVPKYAVTFDQPLPEQGDLFKE